MRSRPKSCGRRAKRRGEHLHARQGSCGERSAYLGDGRLASAGLAVEDPMERDIERLLAPCLALPVAQLEVHQLAHLMRDAIICNQMQSRGAIKLEVHQLAHLGLHLVEAGERLELLELGRVVEHRLGTAP